MSAARSLDLLVNAARLYYEQGRSQQEVAAALGVSGSSVSRILAAAREQGVVVITVRDPRQVVRRVPELEAQLVSAFGLAEAWVGTVPAGMQPVDAAALVAARLFVERLGAMRRVGLSWGTTIGRFVEAVEVDPAPRELELLPLVGGMAALDTGPDGSSSLQTLARKCGAKASRLEAPAIVESPQTGSAMMRESVIVNALEKASSADTAFLGIGSVGAAASSRLLAAMKLSPQELRQVEASRPAGDMCGRFFDDSGVPLGPPTSTRVIGVTLEQLARIPTVVAMAAGVEKTRGVLAALRSQVVDIPVLDEALAAQVLRRRTAAAAG